MQVVVREERKTFAAFLTQRPTNVLTMSSFDEMAMMDKSLCLRQGTALTGVLTEVFGADQLIQTIGTFEEQKRAIRQNLVVRSLGPSRSPAGPSRSPSPDHRPAPCSRAHLQADDGCDAFAFPYWFALDALRDETLNPSQKCDLRLQVPHTARSPAPGPQSRPRADGDRGRTRRRDPRQEVLARRRRKAPSSREANITNVRGAHGPAAGG